MIGVANGELFTYADNVDAETVTRWVTVAPEVIVISVALLRGERQTFAVAHSDRLQMQRLTFKSTAKIEPDIRTKSLRKDLNSFERNL